MFTPQIIFIILVAVSGGIVLANHGMPRENYNIGTWLITMIVEVGLLYWGGFFG